MINSNDLKCFLTTAKTLHLTRAAKVLGLSQPALSHCIKRLEEEVGVPLFIRRKDGLLLTIEGTYLLNNGQNICNGLEAIAHYLKTGEEEKKKSLSLGIHPSVAAYTLPQIIKEASLFDLSLKFDLSRVVTSWVEEGKLDCALAINPYPHNNLIINTLAQDRFTLWCHKKYKVPRDENIIFFDPNLHQSHSLLRQIEKLGIKFNKYIEIENLELIAKFVYEGAGVGILPERVVKNYYPESTKIFNEKIKSFTDKICFIYRINNKNNELIKELKSKIKEII